MRARWTTTAMTIACLALLACSNEGSTPTPSPAPKPATATTGAGEAFGDPISEQTTFVALADLLKDPSSFDGKRVRTRGEVVAVCQKAGCWADLRPEGAGDVAVPAHVTMHGHAFFLPKTAKSKLADVEGTISVRTLTQQEVDHFNSEGASLVAGAPVLGVDATGVALR